MGKLPKKQQSGEICPDIPINFKEYPALGPGEDPGLDRRVAAPGAFGQDKISDLINPVQTEITPDH